MEFWLYLLVISMPGAVFAVWVWLFILRPRIRAFGLLAIASVPPVVSSIIKATNAYYNARIGQDHPVWIKDYFRGVAPYIDLINWILYFVGIIWLGMSILKLTKNNDSH